MKKTIQYRHQIHELTTFPNATGAEVGVAEGRFSKELLEAGLKKLYLVDYWSHQDMQGDVNSPQEWHDANFAQVKKLKEKYPRKVVILKGNSLDMADKVKDGSLDFVYLDGNHYYDGVVGDLYAWTAKVKSGGFVMGHDYLNSMYGVRKAVDEFISNFGLELLIVHGNEAKLNEDANFMFYVD